MDRRRFLLTALAGALAAPFAAEAQEAGKVYQIGCLICSLHDLPHGWLASCAPQDRVCDPGDVERRAPRVVAVLRQVEVVRGLMQAGDDGAHPGPGVSRLVKQRSSGAPPVRDRGSRARCETWRGDDRVMAAPMKGETATT